MVLNIKNDIGGSGFFTILTLKIIIQVKIIYWHNLLFLIYVYLLPISLLIFLHLYSLSFFLIIVLFQLFIPVLYFKNKSS